MDTHTTTHKKQNCQPSLPFIVTLLICLIFAGAVSAKPNPRPVSSSGTAATASFVGLDTTTQGNWHGVYGSDGYSVANDSQNIPAYASFGVQNQQDWTWASGTMDPRALQNGANTSRIAATWYNTSSFALNVNLTDGNTHQLALYVLDWDSQGRCETIQISDANSGALLDTRTVSSFTNGTYVIWKLSGDVKINILTDSGPNSVISGAFWGTGGTVSTTHAAVATFVNSDAVTQGNWHGVYGTDGYSVANDSQSIPAYATFAVQNQENWTWASGTTDVRALQTGANTSRIAAAWYNGSKFSCDVNLTDGNTHQIAVYALDWDSQGRSETVQILDANSLATLDTRTISSFTHGIYFIWNVSGHVKINVSNEAGPNSVISGVFFGGSGSASSTPPATGQLSVSPAIVNFGSVNVGSSSSQTFTLTNSGNAAVSISQVVVSGAGLTVSNSVLPISLPAGQSTSIVVSFAPASLTAISGVLTITSNATNSPSTIAISGTGAGSEPEITTQPANQTVTVGSSATFSVANTGTAPMTYQWLKNGGPISGATSSTYATPATTSADNGSTFTVAIANALGSIISNSAALTVNSGSASLSLSASSLSFGNVAISSSSTQSVTLTNAGTANLTVSNVSVSGAGFNASGVPAGTILAPGQTATLSASFAPATSGAATGTVVITSNASGGSKSVALSGTGTTAVSYSVLLSWNASTSTVVGYNTYVSSVSGGPYTKLTASPVSVASYTDSTVQPGETRYYVVTSVNASNVESGYSNEVSAVIP